VHGESERGVGKSLIEPVSTFLLSDRISWIFSAGRAITVKPLIGIFTHGKEETPGYLLELLDRCGEHYLIYPLYETGEIPPVDLSSLLILGGTMSVNDEKEFPWLSDEKACIRSMVESRRPVLGICLGAQMIASAFGAVVFPSVKETGWTDVTWDGNVPGIPLSGTLRVFQWHGETFTLPPGATPLCIGDRVRNQAFLFRSAIGVQFHMEVTQGIIDRWTAGLESRLQAAIRTEPVSSLEGSQEICRTITEAFVSGAYVRGA
jgi:GMP synthase-like glutamine amidotransferase